MKGEEEGPTSLFSPVNSNLVLRTQDQNQPDDWSIGDHTWAVPTCLLEVPESSEYLFSSPDNNYQGFREGCDLSCFQTRLIALVVLTVKESSNLNSREYFQILYLIFYVYKRKMFFPFCKTISTRTVVISRTPLLHLV